MIKPFGKRTGLGLCVALAATLTLVGTGCNKPGGSGGSKNVKLDSDLKKASYAIGQQIGQGMKSQGVKIDLDVLRVSIEDALADRESKMKPEEMQAAMVKMREDMNKERDRQASENKEKGDQFLADNKKRSEVKSTESGLQYEVMTEGTGPVPKATDRVKVHYKGTLVDGSEFDSSYSRNRPAEFPLGGVIKGWTEALQLMKVGSKYKLFIPPDLAYGSRPRPKIPANSVLVFEVELLEIMGDPAKKSAAKPKAKSEKKGG